MRSSVYWSARPGIVGIGTAVPERQFEQASLVRLHSDADDVTAKIYCEGGIKKRHLSIPVDQYGELLEETQAELLDRSIEVGRELGSQALLEALESAGVLPKELGMIVCVSSTGFSVPGHSARILLDLQLSASCRRVDVVGMGCSAGLSGLSLAVDWATAHPDRACAVLCIEVCSALYSSAPGRESQVVNSLFGDGAGALVVRAGSTAGTLRVGTVATQTNVLAMESMGTVWRGEDARFAFHLDRSVPELMAPTIVDTLDQILAESRLNRDEISHWVVHAGGRRVIELIESGIGLDSIDLRHTYSVLRDFGNLSSGSFIVSLGRLQRERITVPGDIGMMITMGPGLSVEAAVLKWLAVDSTSTTSEIRRGGGSPGWRRAVGGREHQKGEDIHERPGN